MSTFVSLPTMITRSLAFGLVAVLATSLAGCGTEESTTNDQTERHAASGSDTTTNSEADASSDVSTASDDFCSAVDGIGTDLTLLTAEDTGDPAQFVEQISQATDRFTTVEPPETIGESWEHVADLLVTVDDALQKVDVSNEADFESALSMDGDSDDVALMIQLPGHVESVGVFVQTECDVDLGITPPAITDVCAAVDPMNLGSVFDNTVPAGEHRAWGAGTVECLWGDSSGPEVGVVVGRAETFQTDILEAATVVDSVAFEDTTIEVYDGAIGPLRARGGRTAMIAVDETGVLVSVATGDEAADAQKAIALAGMVAVELE